MLIWFIGTIGLPEEVKLLVDERAADLANFAAGANEDGMHMSILTES